MTVQPATDKRASRQDRPGGRPRPPARQRRIPIRAKLAGAMCIPTLALTIFVSYEIRGLSDETAEARRQTALATSTHGPTHLILSLQEERNWTVVELIGQTGVVNVGVESYEEARRNTDNALAGFEEELARSEDETVAAYSPAMEGLAELANIRERVDVFTAPRSIDNTPVANDIFGRYKRLIEPFLEGTSQVAEIVDHPRLRQGAALIDTAVRQLETVANLSRQTIIHGVLSRGGVDQTFEIAELGVLLDQLVTQAALLEGETQGVYAPAGDDWLFNTFTGQIAGHVDGAIRTGSLNLGGFLDTLGVSEDATYMGYERRVADILRQEADDLNAAAARRQRLYLLVILLVGAIAIVGMILVSRVITRSLKALTDQAADMAQRRLPSAVTDVLSTPPGNDVSVPRVEPVAIESRDEVADVASALNTVQHAAVDLAVGQAVLRRNIADSFVNLGRRNQNLLSRQISFITELEKNETDPDNLANLFRLDHLAVRMRRNAESLLVLGGVPTTRRYSGPMRVSDVVRAALSEVEDYQRVVIRTMEPVLVVGSTGADLTHLLAELIDNALMFSSRDRTAEVQGLSHPAGYTLTIVDHGRGMRPDEIARANRRLAGTEPFTVAPSKYLGHYVAGHLAARHGIQVRLQEAPTGGIAATVHLPHGVLVSPHGSLGDGGNGGDGGGVPTTGAWSS